MTLFRPCIDLHQGKVKQIVGGSLRDAGEPVTNFETDRSAAYFARLYKEDKLAGGHVIMLGPGNEEAALSALGAYPGGLQVGGGIRTDNALFFLESGASHVIVTSFMFSNGNLDLDKLKELSKTTGKERLVLDVSCRKVQDGWNIATDRWQTVTDTQVNGKTLELLAGFANEFLVHAADAEGLQQGMDEELIALLAHKSPLPVTYAGGARSLDDLKRVDELSEGKVDLTIGSALDIFGGTGVTYRECVEFNRRQG